MKSLKKTLAVVTAIAAMLVAVPAFAELEANVIDKDSTITVTQNVLGTSSPTVTVTATDATDGEMTFLILDNGTDVTNIGADDILYINQQAGSTSKTFTGAINLSRVAAYTSGTALPVGEYPIRLGYTSKTTGDFAIAKAKVVVAETSSGTEVTILWGDVNQDTFVNVNDSAKILSWLIGGSAACGDYTIEEEVIPGLLWGDVNQDTFVNVNDSAKILSWLIGGSAVCGDYTIEENATITINN